MRELGGGMWLKDYFCFLFMSLLCQITLEGEERIFFYLQDKINGKI